VSSGCFLPNAAAAVNHLVISLSISGIADQGSGFRRR
jgi:hypothetical protein